MFAGTVHSEPFRFPAGADQGIAGSGVGRPRWRALQAALIEPFAIAALMSVYFRVIEGQTPNREWDERLSSASRQFRELKERALETVGVPSRATPAKPAE